MASILKVDAAVEFPRSPVALLDVSNLVTYGSIVAGIGAVIAATVYGNVALTGFAIACAVLADTFDGRFARLFTRSDGRRAFGAQLDSLADAVNSAVVPVVALSAFVIRPSHAFVLVWWCAAAVYVVAAVTRLSYYNLTSGGESGFIGLPTPVPALLVSTVLLAPPSPPAAALLLVVCAVAMVAPMRLTRPTGIGLVAFAAWALGVAVWHAVALLKR